ncbi:MAG: hypothetical protein NT069_34810, partial [Planctomycetota bacterium]|nr:hypothetical protein [Planctomycetota bacterium]
MSASDIIAIDAHGHYGAYDRGTPGLASQFMTASAAEVVARAARFRIGITIASPLQAILPRGKG